MSWGTLKKKKPNQVRGNAEGVKTGSGVIQGKLRKPGKKKKKVQGPTEMARMKRFEQRKVKNTTKKRRRKSSLGTWGLGVVMIIERRIGWRPCLRKAARKENRQKPGTTETGPKKKRTTEGGKIGQGASG